MRDTRTTGRRGSSTPARGGRGGGSGQYSGQRGAGVQYGSQKGGQYAAAAPMKRAPARKWKVSATGIGALALLAVIAVAIVIGIAVNAEKQSYYSDTITAGVTIDGKNVSGWEVSRLTSHLKEDYRSRIDQIEVKVSWQDRSWTFHGEDLGAQENVEEVVSRASLLARTGNLEQRREEARLIKAEGREFHVQYSLDRDKFKAVLEEQTAEVAHAGHDATVVFNPSLVEFTIPENIEDLNPAQDEIDKMFLVNPETSGKSVDVDMMVNKIMDELERSSKVELELLVNDFVPKVTQATLKESFHLLNAYRTKLPSTKSEAQPRIDNIELALSKFNGFTLKPGETLSFNDTTGPRTEANGYKPAPTIGGDKALVDDFGGGVCQASTTLYNAALMSGCEILERRSHSFPSSYAWKAFDAMVNWPNSDLKFKNTSDTNLYIKAYVNKPYVYVMIFGKPFPDGIRLKRESEMIYEGPPPPVEIRVDKKGEYSQFVKYQDDPPYVLVSGQPEMRFKAYLLTVDANGNVLEKKELYEDRFKEIKRVEIVGKEPRPTPTPAPFVPMPEF